jgi:glycosyltransferase involved in cell wall biosynthesis
LLNELQLPSRLKAIENPLPDGFIGLQVDIERQPIIGFVASWYDLKGVQAIRTALTIVLRRFDKARFRLIGTGVEFQKEKEFPADVCERVEVIGKIYDKEELRKHYQNISVLVLPSYYESFGMVATEAMACGCAVVATRTGFAAGLVDGSEALLLDRPDGNALAEALERLMSDEFLRRTIAMNGWERVQGLRWDAAVQELESTYLRWLEEVRAGVNKERTVH